MRGQDGLYGRPVPGVGLKHLLDQVVELVWELLGQRLVRSSRHFQNQALPAAGLELTQRRRDEVRREEERKKK